MNAQRQAQLIVAEASEEEKNELKQVGAIDFSKFDELEEGDAMELDSEEKEVDDDAMEFKEERTLMEFEEENGQEADVKEFDVIENGHVKFDEPANSIFGQFNQLCHHDLELMRCLD